MRRFLHKAMKMINVEFVEKLGIWSAVILAQKSFI